MALVSDAGMPLVSDPGLILVQAAVAAGLAVEVLPGPSAALTALVASGMPAETWRFVGFLPRRRGELEALLRSEDTLVAFESPRRVAATLGVLAGLDPERPVAVCRELTKLHEEIVRGTAGELAERYVAEPVRGEVVLVIGPAAAGAADRAAAVEAVRRLVEAGARPRAAASVVAGLTGLSANDLYGARRDRRGVTGRTRMRARWCHGAAARRADRPDRRRRRCCIGRVLLLPVFTTLLLTLLNAAAAHAGHWTAPLPGAPVVREFDFDARTPFARGGTVECAWPARRAQSSVRRAAGASRSPAGIRGWDPG